MLGFLQVLTVMVVALPAALSVAHALELPGKLRLYEATYRAVQRIYYPGFTIGGIAEVPAAVLTAILLVLAPRGTAAFWLVLAALAGTIATVAIYWLRVHPVNRYWMKGAEADAAATRFFGTAAGGPEPAWTALRDRWEQGHATRAVASSLALLALVTALAVWP